MLPGLVAIVMLAFGYMQGQRSGRDPQVARAHFTFVKYPSRDILLNSKISLNSGQIGLNHV